MSNPDIAILVDRDADAGMIRPLHGVNNGPVCFGGLVDVSDRFGELRIPSVRLHDCEWPNPIVVDIPRVFPDFGADADDPASYRFDRTDDYIRSILDVGADIVFRLGTSIEHTARKYDVHPPADFDKWADIAVHVIRHYNDGWANGYAHGIRYWEVWNEANIGKMMWSGSHAAYFDLYDVTARAIKAHDPRLMVGGPAVGGGLGPFLVDFVRSCRERSLPLDFCSWHTYTADPFEFKRHADGIRDLLDEHGYRRAESHLNEWNYDFDWGEPDRRAESFGRLQGAEGAAFSAFTLMLLQDCPVDVANYYTGDTSWWGLFDPYGRPRKPFHAFKAFAELLATPHRVACEVTGGGDAVIACAGQSDDRRTVQVLVSNRSPDARPCAVRMTLPAGGARVTAFVLDADRDLAPVDARECDTPALSVDRTLGGHSVCLIRSEPR